jgi:hypothetical protein
MIALLQYLPHAVFAKNLPHRAIQDCEALGKYGMPIYLCKCRKNGSIADQKVDKITSIPRSFKKFDKLKAYDIVSSSIVKLRESYYRIQLTRMPSLPLSI